MKSTGSFGTYLIFEFLIRACVYHTVTADVMLHPYTGIYLVGIHNDSWSLCSGRYQVT